jgi:uncharacterized protein YegP (UPF0339 family)
LIARAGSASSKHFYIYQDRDRILAVSQAAANSKTVADSAVGYSSRQACVEGE